MKKIIALLVLFAPVILVAWDAEHHQEMARIALKDVSLEWGLTQPIQVLPLMSLLEKLPHELGDPWHFSHWLKINPAVPLDSTFPETRGKTLLTPHEILTAYSNDPDDGRDMDLFTRNHEGRIQPQFHDQKWFGPPDGPDSQAFRHIEKPPFSWRHPVSTMGVPLRSVGEATQRAEVWFLLSKLAFSLDEPYWGWRFLANSFHYLQDLHNPYHSAQISPALAWQGLTAYLRWGRKEKGFIQTFARLIGNSHRFFESYVARPENHNNRLKLKISAALSGGDLLPQKFSSAQELAIDVRDQANRFFPELPGLVDQIMDPKLRGPYDFKSDKNNETKPITLLQKGTDFEAVNRRLFEIVEIQFRSAGRVQRTAVRMALDQKAKEPTEVILTKLENILGKPLRPEDLEN